MSEPGLWDDGELVIYTAEPNGEYEPKTDWGQDLELVSFSLWARLDEDKEIPIYHISETGSWLSLSARQFHPDPAEPVSEAFVESVVNMVDEGVGEGWGDPTKEAYEEMRDVEQYLWNSLQWAFLKVESPEAAGVINWCEGESE